MSASWNKHSTDRDRCVHLLAAAETGRPWEEPKEADL
jgi:hypothetical protein